MVSFRINSEEVSFDGDPGTGEGSMEVLVVRELGQ